jgi:hypothetical protein
MGPMEGGSSVRKLLVVCIDQESGRHLAVDLDDPTQFEVAYTKEAALASFLLHHCPEISVTEIPTP